MAKIIESIKWNLYYRYKDLNISDEEGKYSLFHKILIILNTLYCTYINKGYWNITKFKKHIVRSPEKNSNIIYKSLTQKEPCMIARFGGIEQTIIANYLSIKSSKRSLLNCITGKQPYWWWEKKIKKEFKTNAGFFPNEIIYIEEYCRQMIEDIKQLDVLLTWYGKEFYILKDKMRIPLISLQESEPWWQKDPWTLALKGKNVLVIHPFSELIEEQYKKRKLLFINQDVLPDFNLITIKAVQSINGECDDFKTWFEALDYMEKEIKRTEFDIALIGCGAYGFCLAAYIKRIGKKAFHMGGVLQLLFGIKGSRWEDPNYHPKYNYNLLFNKYWIKPTKQYIPKSAKLVENSCYW